MSNQIQCPKCKSYKVGNPVTGCMIALHTVLVILTAGIWVLILLVYSAIRSKKAKMGERLRCDNCGYEWNYAGQE